MHFVKPRFALITVYINFVLNNTEITTMHVHCSFGFLGYLRPLNHIPSLRDRQMRIQKWLTNMVASPVT